MPVEPTPVTRPPLRLRADVPAPGRDWLALVARPSVFALAGLFVLIGGASQELSSADARLGLACAEPIGPFGRAFGYWDPSLWPLPVAMGRIWAWFEELGPSQGAVRWPMAIAGVLTGIFLARRARLTLGPRAGIFLGFAWFGSVAMIDRSSGLGLDLITGLGTVVALDRLLAKGSGWPVGLWAAFAFLAGGWPPLAVLALATVVLGRKTTGWSWRISVPIILAVVGWSTWALLAAPAEAWATALALPITRSSAWGLALVAIAAGCPFSPFAGLMLSRSIREGLSTAGNNLTLAWLKVAGASLIVGTIVPGLASAALVPALAGLAMAAAAACDRAWVAFPDFGRGSRRFLLGVTLTISFLWFLLVLGWGGYLGFAIAYYRAVLIVAAIVTTTALIFAWEAIRLDDARRSLVAMALVAAALKLTHWGFYVPESNYREGAGPWGRAIGQWVPEKHPVYVFHAWPSDLAFAIARPVRQLASPQQVEYQPGKGSKFILLLDSEYAEYQNWSEGWPRLIKVAEFEDETGLGHRILTRTEGPVILERPHRRAALPE